MRTVLVMAMKDLRLMSRDWLGLFFILAFPIMIGIFFGSMYGGVGDTGSVKLRLAVVDEDESATSKQFVANLKETGNVEVESLPRQAAIDRVRRGELVGLIALPKGFGESAGLPWLESPAIQLGLDPSRKAEAGLLEGLVMQAAGRLMMNRFQDPASMHSLVQQGREDIASDENISPALRPALVEMMNSLDSFMQSWTDVENAEAQSAADDNDDENANRRGFELARIETLDVTRQYDPDSAAALVHKVRSKWDISFPQAMIWGILACAAGFAISIVRERKQGTFLRLQVAPVTRAQILAGKATACYLAVISLIAIMALLGIMLGMQPESPGLLALAAACVAFSFVGIMMLMSVIGRTEEAVSGAAWGANMLMAMFGGGMIPLVFMPRFMQTLSNFSPAKWSILALEGAIWRGFALSEMVLPCAILLAVGAVCLAAGGFVLSRRTD
ncbi:MAG: ABC transporter permease [Pirellulales bacterium]